MLFHARAAMVVAALSVCSFGTANAAEVGTTTAQPVPLEHLVRNQAALEVGDMDSEKACLTEAIFHESRAEPVLGQLAVANVIMNRTRASGFPRSICGVINQHGQFTYPRGRAIRKSEVHMWTEARAVASLALQGILARVGRKALFFHSAKVRPNLGSKAVRIAQIGAHIFYGKR